MPLHRLSAHDLEEYRFEAIMRIVRLREQVSGRSYGADLDTYLDTLDMFAMRMDPEEPLQHVVESMLQIAEAIVTQQHN